MVAFGKWKLYSWNERPDLADGPPASSHPAHFQSLQELRSDWRFLPELRHLLAHAGNFEIHRLDDNELLVLAAHELASGRIYLVQDDDRTHLEQLWKAVSKTSVARRFLDQLSQSPKLKWGNPTNGKKGEYTADDEIVLNRDLKDSLSDCEWKQVIAMELGKAANEKAFSKIYSRADSGNLSQGDFADEVLGVEMESRNLVIEAFNSKKICLDADGAYKPVFEGGIMTLAAYKNDPRGLKDWKDYADEWAKNYAAAYAKKHPRSTK